MTHELIIKEHGCRDFDTAQGKFVGPKYTKSRTVFSENREILEYITEAFTDAYPDRPITFVLNGTEF